MTPACRRHSPRSISISSTLLVRTPSPRNWWITSARRSSSGLRTLIARLTGGDRAEAHRGRRAAAAGGRAAPGRGRRRAATAAGRPPRPTGGLRAPVGALSPSPPGAGTAGPGGSHARCDGASGRCRVGQPQATSTESATARNSAAGAHPHAGIGLGHDEPHASGAAGSSGAPTPGRHGDAAPCERGQALDEAARAALWAPSSAPAGDDSPHSRRRSPRGRPSRARRGRRARPPDRRPASRRR